MSSIYVTKAPIDDSVLNGFGDKGWLILIMNPMVVYKDRDFGEDSDLARPFIDRIEQLANEDQQYRKSLSDCGVGFNKIYQENGKRKWALSSKSRSKLGVWRIEMNASDTLSDGRGIVYMTFGDPMLNFPALADSNELRKYFGKEIEELSDFIEEIEVDDGND